MAKHKCKECGRENRFLKLDPSGICRDCYLADLNSATELRNELQDQIRTLRIELHDVKYQVSQAKSELNAINAQSASQNRQATQTPSYQILYTQSVNAERKPVVSEVETPVRFDAPVAKPSASATPVAKQSTLASKKKSKQKEQYLEALRIVVEKNRASVSLLQEYMDVDFNQAADLLKQLERRGIVSTPKDFRPRTVLVLYDDVKHLFED